MLDFTRCTRYFWGHSSQASWTTPSQCWCLLLDRHAFKHSLMSHEHLGRGESEKLLIRGKNMRRTVVSWVSLTIHKTRRSCSTLCSMHGRVRMHHGTSMGLLPDTWNCGLRMRRECRERFPRHQLQRKPLVSNPGMHHGTCVTHVPWCMSGSLTCGGRGKRSRHSRRMRNPQFYVSGKRPMVAVYIWLWMDMFIISLHKMDPIFIAKKNMPWNIPIRKKLTLMW